MVITLSLISKPLYRACEAGPRLRFRFVSWILAGSANRRAGVVGLGAEWETRVGTLALSCTACSSPYCHHSNDSSLWQPQLISEARKKFQLPGVPPWHPLRDTTPSPASSPAGLGWQPLPAVTIISLPYRTFPPGLSALQNLLNQFWF